MTDYNDGKWHGWNGGECPIDERSICDVMLNDGETSIGLPARSRWWRADILTPIVAFRVTKAHKEPRKVWIWVSNSGHLDAFNSRDELDMHIVRFGRAVTAFKASEVLEND